MDVSGSRLPGAYHPSSPGLQNNAHFEPRQLAQLSAGRSSPGRPHGSPARLPRRRKIFPAPVKRIMNLCVYFIFGEQLWPLPLFLSAWRVANVGQGFSQQFDRIHHQISLAIINRVPAHIVKWNTLLRAHTTACMLPGMPLRCESDLSYLTVFQRFVRDLPRFFSAM